MTDATEEQRKRDESRRAIDATIRALESASNEIDAGKAPPNVERMIAEATNAARGAVPSAFEAPHSGTSIGVAVERMKQRIADRKAGKWKIVATPFEALNTRLGGGFEPGVHILVGGSGSGKSTLAVQCAIDAARAGHPVAYVSLELEAEQVAARMVAALHNASTGSTRAYWSNIYRGTDFRGFDYEARCEELAKLPIVLDVHSSLQWRASFLRTVADQARAHGDASRIPFVVLDYLQLVGEEESDKGADARTRISRAASAAHDIATELRAAVLVVSSVARSNYGVAGGDRKKIKESGVYFGVETPNANDSADVGRTVGHPLFGEDALIGLGKESGEIEYSASNVLALVKSPPPKTKRERKKGAKPAPRIVALALAKVRMGRPGWLPLLFDGATFDEGSTDDAIAFNEAAHQKDDDTNQKDDATKPKSNGASGNEPPEEGDPFS